MRVTAAQAMKAIVICQNLSDSYRPIYVFRFEPRTGYIFILGGENIQVVIPQDGNWEFINDET
jgi:hypothetical protein